MDEVIVHQNVHQQQNITERHEEVVHQVEHVRQLQHQVIHRM